MFNLRVLKLIRGMGNVLLEINVNKERIIKKARMKERRGNYYPTFLRSSLF